jgi:HSP20 family protein
MALVRWNPWGELFDLHSQMDQLFQSLTTDTPSNGGQFTNLPVDIKQSDDAYTIEASVPGFRPEDVEVTFDDGVLTIRGQHRWEQEQKQGSYVRRERKMSSVMRQISMPAEVRADEITANFEHGVLTITVPRAQKAQPKRIQVQTTSTPHGGQVIEGQSQRAEHPAQETEHSNAG